MATVRMRPAPARRTTRILVAGLLVALVGIAVVSGYQLLTSPSSTVSGPTDVSPAVGPLAPTTPSSQAGTPAPSLPPPERRERRGPLGTADGAVPDGASVFDDGLPGVANLDPALLAALRQAATEAADDGVVFHVNSGWRSPDYQEHLLQEAVAEHGSEEEAARWVATPETSAHVSGDAVDLGPDDATDWLSEHGDDYGLCPVYDNEPWHFELRPEALDQGCPPTYADPTEDPRMHQ